MEPIHTQRLTLRPLVHTDLDDLHKLFANADVMRYIIGRPRSHQESAEKLNTAIHQHEEFGFGLCATLWRATGELIGRCGWEPREEGIEGELAWMFAPPWWRRGLGVEVGRTLIEYGLCQLNLQRVYARADPRNTASIAIMQRLEMVLVAETDEEIEYELCANSPRRRASSTASSESYY